MQCWGIVKEIFLASPIFEWVDEAKRINNKKIIGEEWASFVILNKNWGTETWELMEPIRA